MKRIGAVSILLFILPLICNAVETSFFEDRSATIVGTPENIQDDSLVYVSDKYISNSKQIEETSVADLISHVIGGPVINKNSARDSLPQGSVFDKASANLFVVVDSVGSDLLSHYETIFPPMRVMEGGKRMKMTRVAYPQDSVASLATLATGNTPSVHGIVNKQWRNEQGLTTVAYKAQALPYAASVFDVISQAFEGRSLVVSASADYQMASALGVHQYLHAENALWNKLGFSWNDEDLTFASLYDGATTPSKLRLSLSASQLLSQMETAQFSLENSHDSISFVAATSEVVVDMPSANVECMFNLARKADFTFFVEMLFVKNVIAELKSEDLKSLISDHVPDLFSFSFSSLKAIQTIYGKNSPQHMAALAILDSVLLELTTELNSLYDNKVATEIVFLGQSAYSKIQSNQILQDHVYRAVRGSVESRSSFNNYFPIIYVRDGAAEGLCEKVDTALSYFAPEPMKAVCPQEHEVHLRDVGVFTLRQSTNNGTNTDGYPDNVAFQIVLWTSIALGFALAGTIYALCFMDVGADSFLYRTPNPKFHAQ